MGYLVSRFWKKAGFVPTYVRQTRNDLTGEHTTIMLKLLQTAATSTDWLAAFYTDFRLVTNSSG
jgi:N-acetyltransferase 10